MFFFLSKLLGVLLNPLIWIVILLLLAVRLKSRRRFYLNIALISFIIFSNPLLSNLCMGWLELEAITLSKNYSVAVVLTGMTNPHVHSKDQVDFSDAADRFTEALRLYHTGKVEKILISGGSGLLLDQTYNESQQLGVLAVTLGIRAGDLILEGKSRNTFENAKYCKPILEQLAGNDQVVLVTSAFHMRRSWACFRKQNINVVPYPVDFRSSSIVWDYNLWLPSAGAFGTWYTILRELVGMIFYKLAGYT